MAKQPKTTLFAPEDIDKKRDLRNVLIACGIFLLGFAPMILISNPIGNVLTIPGLELALVALLAALVTVGGLLALRTDWPVRYVTWALLVSYTLLVSAMVYLSGSPLTPMFAIYMLVVMAASFLLGQRGALAIAALCSAEYGILLVLEYVEILKVIPLWRLAFTPYTRGTLFVINWLAVSIPLLLAAQLAGALAERLRTTNMNLRESERLRESLSSMIVHDLRNPLTALLGGLDIIRLTMADHMDADQKHLLENARRSGHALLGMVGELLDISKMEAGKLTLNVQPTDLRALIDENIDLVRVLTETGELEIRAALTEDVASVPCDRQLIGRVIANLLSNAIKHTPPKGLISVVAIRRGDFATVSVADTGPGIPPEYHQRIFEKFGQIEQPGKERRGTGLGLPFCKMAVEAHGGQIWVESEVGRGSTFYFSLPMSASPGPSAPPPPQAPLTS